MNASNSEIGNDEATTTTEQLHQDGDRELETEYKHNFVFEYWVIVWEESERNRKIGFSQTNQIGLLRASDRFAYLKLLIILAALFPLHYTVYIGCVLFYVATMRYTLVNPI